QMLTPGGFLLLEHGWQQGEAVRAVFRRSGYSDVETCRDYGGNERVTCGRFTP
ncbi:protein-(glutamine-N5) methyltransferase, release factor-specific, partial [Salmonella enterica subsp. enterica serovar Haifa]|nr:protein-(glutamine-N5) methyltransferase, release factor-specific [Salmonella enterica subsp. enterica serovar Typhimurium]EDN4447091.1 protein-(glutamine-N5) methyltransferase, release factor-specific [Salmonella enterica subsp. enterica serovar Mbandaka]EHX6209119.1 protein-(glutamine-N5) methyltransferase, release factor-specific [Salmonella enterica subsp. enterica serovar Haifa]